MTTDDDRVAYLAGEAEAEVDDVTRADLDELRGLLADPAVWAEPSPGLEDAIVAAIAAEAAEAAEGRPAAPPPSRAATAVTRPARRRSHRTRNTLTAVAAAAVLGVAGYVVVSTGGGDDGVTEVSMAATDLVPGASGTAEVSRTDSGWRIELDATGLPRLDSGRFYQAWLKNADDVLVAIGTFNEPADVVLWAGVSPVDFPTLTVTEEQADGDQASSGRRVLVGTIDLDS